MTTALPFPVPGVPGGGVTPSTPAAKPAGPKVATQRDFSPVLDGARADVDRRQAPADQGRPRQDVGRRDRANPRADDRDLDNQKPGKPDAATPPADETSARPTDDEPTSKATRNEQPNAEATDQPANEEVATEDLEGGGEEATTETEHQGTVRTLPPVLLGLDDPAATVPSAAATGNAEGELATDTSTELSASTVERGGDASTNDLAEQIDGEAPPTELGNQPTGEATSTAETAEVATPGRAATTVASEATVVPAEEAPLPDSRRAVDAAAPRRAGTAVADKLSSPTSEVPATTDLDATTTETAPTIAAATPTELAGAVEAPVDGPEPAPTASAITSRAEAPITTTTAPSAGAAAVAGDLRATAGLETTPPRFDMAGTSPAATDLATDEAQEQLWGQVQRALTRVRSGAEGQELRMRLRPAELGDLLVQVRAAGDQLAVRLVTTSGAAHQALLNDQPRLAEELRNAGFDGGSVDISQQDQQPGDPNHGSGGESDSADRGSGASPSSSVFASADGRPADRRQIISVQRPRGGLVDITL